MSRLGRGTQGPPLGALRDFCDTDDRDGVSSRACRRSTVDPRDPLRHDCGACDLPSISPNRIWRVIFIAVPEGVAAFMVIRP
jgi:hypothetical protein